MQLTIQFTEINEEEIERFSIANKEPKWLAQFRIDSFKKYVGIPLPQPYYTNYSKIDSQLKKFSVFEKTDNVNLKEFYHENSYSIINVDSKIQKYAFEDFDKKGIIFKDIKNAIAENKALIKKYFNVSDNKFACINDALFNSGIFLYVPKNTNVSIPFRLLFIISNQNTRIFSKTIIVLEEGSSINFIEEKYSTEFKSEEKSVCSDNMEVYLGRNSTFNIASLQNFNENTYNSSTRRAFLHKDSRANWNQAIIGSGFTTLNLNNYLNEEGAVSNDVQVYFGRRNQHFDITSNIINNKPNTKGNIFVKGVLKESARCVFQGLIKISPKAQLSDSFLAAHAMLLNPGARADSIPSLEIEANDVKASHASSVAQIDEDQLFYLKSRGLDDLNAKKMLVSGFLQQATEKITDKEFKDKIIDMIGRKFE